VIFHIFIIQNTDGTFLRVRVESREPIVWAVWWEGTTPLRTVKDGDELKDYMNWLINDRWDWDRGTPLWRWRQHEDLFWDTYLYCEEEEEITN
jgi:hypothetical protein